MNVFISFALIICAVWIAWWWFAGRNKPAFPPLAISDDDPLMTEARRKAEESIPQMLELFRDAKDSTRVKVPFLTSVGETEYLWGELLSVEGSSVKVRYLTPPVSHSRALERVQVHTLADIVDWVVTKDPNRYIGGYSMRVMFQRGREQWGSLPPELLAEEEKYGRPDSAAGV